MASVSDWSANEKENLFLDDQNLSDERGLRVAKLMAAVKGKADIQDSAISAIEERQAQVNVGFVLKGTAATSDDLPEDPAAGDTYIVTAEDGEYFAWNGTEWVDLGLSDAGLVHKTGAEMVAGLKSFSGDGGVANFPYSGNTINTVCVAEFLGRRDTKGKSGSFFQRYRENKTQGEAAASMFQIATVENEDMVTRFAFRSNNGAQSIDASFYGLISGPEGTTGSVSLGQPGNAWDNVYVSSGQISTSDERLKTSINSIPDAVLDAWGDVGWVQFQFKDSVQTKGAAARFHAGAVAQRIDAAFKEHGLDASQYGLFCHDSWADGEDGSKGGDRFSLRYDEALCIEAAFQRRRAERLEARLADVEARLAALEVSHGN